MRASRPGWVSGHAYYGIQQCSAQVVARHAHCPVRMPQILTALHGAVLGRWACSADRTFRLRACMQQQEYFGMRGSVKEDVAKLRASPLINKDIEIYGFVYDVKARSSPKLASDLALTYRLNTSICRQGVFCS